MPPTDDPSYVLAHSLACSLACWRAGDFGKAERICRALLAEHSHHPAVLMMLSLTLHGGGNSAVALGFARRAIAVASLAAEAHHNAGVILTALGRLDEALPCFHQAIVLAPSHLPERPVPHWRACRGRAESGTVELDLGFTVDAAYAHAASPIPPRLSPLGR